MAELLIPALPRAFLGPLSEITGTSAYLLGGRARQAVRANLAVVAPHRPDREGLVRRTFVNQALNYLEAFRIARLDADELARSVRLEGFEQFAAARARGRGLIAASAHFGAITLVGQLALLRGYDVTLPIEPTRSALMRAVNRGRAAKGLRTVSIDSAFGIHRALRRGGVLAFLADRAVTGVGERVPFFGREALLPSAPVALALRTGAAFLPTFAWRVRGGFAARVEPPLELPQTGDRDADVREGVRRFAAVLERYIAIAPEQWTVFEPVWDDAATVRDSEAAPAERATSRK